MPREHRLPDGALVVSSHWVHGTRDAVTVPAADEQLYRLLGDVLDDAGVPALMPARLATSCSDLLDVQHAVQDLERGSADIGGVSWGMSYCQAVDKAIADHRARDPLRLAAVGCSGSKYDDDGVLPARERYKGSYWVKKRDYGDACADDWRVLSAEHALLDPETPIEYYERTPDDLRGVPVDADARLPSGDPVETLLDQWALDVYEALTQWLTAAAGGLDPRDVELEVLLGRAYREPLAERGVFDQLRAPGALSIAFPFQEVEQAQGGLFQQIDWLGDAVA